MPSSSHRISTTTRRFARQIRAYGVPLFADNGSIDVFDQVIEQHEPTAKEIRRDFQQMRSELHRSLVAAISRKA